MAETDAVLNWSQHPHSMHNEMVSQSRQPYQIAATSVFLALALPAVLLRIWVRKHMMRSLGVDDYMMIIALVLFIVYSAALMKIVENGGGTHIQNFSKVNLRSAVEWTVTNEVFYLLTQIFLKLSLGYFFLRVILKKNQRRFIIATVAFSTINNVGHVFFVVFRCGNPRFLVENTIHQKCLSNNFSVVMGYEQAAVSTITDLIFAFMPISLLWNANMDLRSKISAGLILSMGAFGSICSIVRFLYVRNLAFGEDFFWTAVNISIWSTIELGMGIIAGSLATLRPLLKRVVRVTHTHLSPSSKSGKFNNKKESWESTSKPPPTWNSPDSLPSVFRPWESVGASNGFITTCRGPDKACKGFKWGSRNASRNVSKNRSRNVSKMASTIDTMHTIDQDRAAIWPIDEEMGGIAKVVDVQVSVSDAPIDEAERPSRGSRLSEEIRGLWKGRQDEENIWMPERPLPTVAPKSSSDWDRIPSLHIVRSNSTKTPPGSRGTIKSSGSSSFTK